MTCCFGNPIALSSCIFKVFKFIMHNHIVTTLLLFYGIFLILCGIVSVAFIGMKAKTALVSGGTSGLLAILLSYLICIDFKGAQIAGLILNLALFIVFSWRATKTLFKVFELINSPNEELHGKAIAFLIISLMAVVSVFVFVLQLLHY